MADFFNFPDGWDFRHVRMLTTGIDVPKIGNLVFLRRKRTTRPR